MKLKELFENEFDNKEHASVKDEVEYLKNYGKALEKECDLLLNIYATVRTKYYIEYCKRIGLPSNSNYQWCDTPEYIAFTKTPEYIKFGKAQYKVILNKKQITRLKNK